MFTVILFVILLGLGYFIGSAVEKSHFASIAEREQTLSYLPVMTTGKKEQFDAPCNSQLVYGSVVVGQDYFKLFIFSLISLVGGRVTSYEKLIERARREALLRLKQSAADYGAEAVIHLRFETAVIMTNNRNGGGAFEVFAYGTALQTK